MTISIRIKAAGKRRDMLERRPHEVPDGLRTAGGLVEALVRDNVRAYNAGAAAPYYPALTQRELDDGAYAGRIAFGDRENAAPQNEDQAVANALQCFEDGIFRVLINEEEAAGPDAAIALNDGDAVTFIRLVMLAGRRW